MKLKFLFYILAFLSATAALAQESISIGKLNLDDLDPKGKRMTTEQYDVLIVIIDKTTDLKNIEYIKDKSFLNLDVRLEKFPAELDTKKFSNLRELTIESEMLDDLSALTNLDSLRQLKITAPKIRNADFLKNLPALKEVEIFSDSLEDIPRMKNSRIELLTISVGSATPVENLASFRSLKEITFMKGGLKSFPDYLSKNLEKISIGPQPLLKDIQHLGAYKRLRSLIISNSGLVTISGDFSNLKPENINLSENRLLKNMDALFTIPKISGMLSVEYCDALNGVDLSGKCFDYGTIRFSSCRAFRNFKGYSECTRIKKLEFTVNDLHTFPENLSVIPNLEEIHVHEGTKSLYALKDLKSLKKLFFAGPETEIPETFYTNSNIEALRIFGTQITDLSGLVRLKKLNSLNITNAEKLVRVPDMAFLLAIPDLGIYDNPKLEIKRTERNGIDIISRNKKE